MREGIAILFLVASILVAFWASIIIITGMGYLYEIVTLAVLFYLIYRVETNNNK